ncbi:MAG: response regulator [Candidatus Krumholzibacteriota bacterium]
MTEATERKIHLLIVDDEVDFLEALGERLELRDFHVRTVTNGNDALELCRTDKFDLALIDLKMPGMDGKDLLTRIKDEHRYLEVIILTGHGSLGSAVECAKLGAFSYLPKPYQLDELLKILQDAYAERLKKKFAADVARTEDLLKIAQQESPRGILRRMKELDDDER